MKRYLQPVFTFLLFILVAYLCMVGVKDKLTVFQEADGRRQETAQSVSTPPVFSPDACRQSSAAYISGPLVAAVGELCVFRLNDPDMKADWIIVPPAEYYIDSSGSSLVFASNVPATYTIVAAIVENNVPKILLHVIEYGFSPSPSPSPTPTPTPATLAEWVAKNIPDAGRAQSAALASSYESVVEGIDRGTIRSLDAAFAAIRTSSQTKIQPEVWGPFLDQLSARITERMAGSNDVRKLGTIFGEVASGLRRRPEVRDGLEKWSQ